MAVYTCALPKGGSTKTSTGVEIVSWPWLAAASASSPSTPTSRATCQPAWGSPRRPRSKPPPPRCWTPATLREAAEPAPTAQGVDVIVGAHDLTALEEQPPPDLVTSLRDMLPTVWRWDHVVIDTPPNVGALTMAGLAVSRSCDRQPAGRHRGIRPARPPRGCGRRARRVASALAADQRRRPGHGRSPARSGDPRALAQRYGDRVTPPVRQAVAVRDAYTAGMGVSVYDPICGRADRAATDHLLTLTMGAH